MQRGVSLTWTPVSSSNPDAVSYDPETRTLSVRFKNGTIYAYANVPEFEYADLLEAESVGSFVNDHIKGTYSFRKL